MCSFLQTRNPWWWFVVTTALKEDVTSILLNLPLQTRDVIIYPVDNVYNTSFLGLC